MSLTWGSRVGQEDVERTEKSESTGNVFGVLLSVSDDYDYTASFT